MRQATTIIVLDFILHWLPGVEGGGDLSFQDTGLYHSDHRSTTHKSGEFLKSVPINPENLFENYTHKSVNAKTAHQ